MAARPAPSWHVAVAAVLRPGLPGPVRAVTGGPSLPQNRAISPVVSAGVVGVVLIVVPVGAVVVSGSLADVMVGEHA